MYGLSNYISEDGLETAIKNTEWILMDKSIGMEKW